MLKELLAKRNNRFYNKIENKDDINKYIKDANKNNFIQVFIITKS